jgi:hypothetical protein
MTQDTPTRTTERQFVQVGERAVSPYGFNLILMEGHLKDHPQALSGAWCTVGCLARTMFARNTEHNRSMVRQRIARARNYFIGKGLYLLVEYEPHGHGHHGEAKAMKFMTTTVGVERSLELQYAEEQLERMRKRKELSEENYQKAMAIIHPMVTTVSDVSDVTAVPTV